MGLKRKAGALIYHLVAKRLPVSYSSLKLGQTALRRFCGRLMLAECGKEVNIEKNAIFSEKVTLGDRSDIGINAKIYGTCHIGDHVMMGADVTIIDSENVTAGERVLVDLAIRLRDEGLCAKDIAKALEQAKSRLCILGRVDTLAYL